MRQQADIHSDRPFNEIVFDVVVVFVAVVVVVVIVVVVAEHILFSI